MRSPTIWGDYLAAKARTAERCETLLTWEPGLPPAFWRVGALLRWLRDYRGWHRRGMQPALDAYAAQQEASTRVARQDIGAHGTARQEETP